MKVEFIKSAFQEKHYPPPDKPEIAFGGKSNVGKSSLLNVLVNRRKMAISAKRAFWKGSSGGPGGGEGSKRSVIRSLGLGRPPCER